VCILPPMCVFCVHYNQDAGIDDPDCSAFAEIPDAIFVGDFDPHRAFAGDGGVRFELVAEMAEDYAEVMAVRNELREAMLAAQTPDSDEG
jgi:hypothetical protein